MILGEYLTVGEMMAVEMNSQYLGHSTQEMMENAGRSLAEQVMKRFKTGSTVTVFSGLSGNGGDGFTAARHLASQGYKVQVLILGDPRNISLENSRRNYTVICNMKATIKLTIIKDTSLIPEIKADVVIDGLIGTSMKGPLRPPFLQAVQAINKSKAFKISIDIPTGMVADTGKVHGESVNADLTVTFHKPKKGYQNKPPCAGELIVAPIGIPPEAELFIGPGDVQLNHRKRAPSSHKGMFGRLLVIGGSETYSGAPGLAALGGYATGLDLVYVAVPESAAQPVMNLSPSLITVKLRGERLNQKNVQQIKPFLSKVDAVAIGPGLGMHEKTRKAFISLLEMIQERNLPVVIDADGLKIFAENKTKLTTPTIFTPHSREFKLLTGKKTRGDFKELGKLVQKHAKKLGAVILLKGNVDVISDGEYTRYNWTGNPGMTVGGTGDVLTGIVAGYLAQGTSHFYSACTAAFLNGAAGDKVIEKKGYHLLPEDLVKELSSTIESCLHRQIFR